MLFVRDEPSQALAIRQGIGAPQLAIDSAFMLDVGHTLPPIASYCLVARGDLESRYDTDAIAGALRRRGTTVVCDWASHMTLPACVPKWLIVGGVLVIDDYDSWSGCRRAVNDYFAGRKAECRFERRARLHIVKL